MSDGSNAMDAARTIFDAMFPTDLLTIARLHMPRISIGLSLRPSNGVGSPKSCPSFVHLFTRVYCIHVGSGAFLRSLLHDEQPNSNLANRCIAQRRGNFHMGDSLGYVMEFCLFVVDV